MAFTIEQLRNATDEELIAAHDKLAGNTIVGTAFYLDEIQRREQARAIAASNRLARASFWLSLVNAAVAVVAVVIALSAG